MPRSRDRDISQNLMDKIKSLTSELSSTNKITTRRETAARLLELLSKERNRNRCIQQMIELSIENGYSRAKARKRAHQLFWGPIISSTFLSAEQLVKQGTKMKLQPDDVKLPLKILHYSDMASDGSPSRLTVEDTSRLDDNQIHKIFDFCFKMLEIDEVRDVAEVELMNTLVYVCENVDYVARLRPEDEVTRILGTVEATLFVEGEVAVIASRVFAAILESCVELGMGLFVVVNQCLRLVAKWCNKRMENATSNPRELRYLFRGITALLRFHPEQSIRPLSRYGRVLLKFSKRTYLTAIVQHKHAIHGYLVAHIIVNQKAGELRGLLPGELGDLGKSTLNSEQLEQLLPMVLSSLAKTELTLTVKKRVLWKALDPTIRRHLECCARLLACAQRRFLVDEEWKLLDDPNDFFTRMAREYSRDKDDVVRSPSYSSYPCCPTSVLVGSPWVKHVLMPLLQMVPELKTVTHFGTASTVDSYSQGSTQDTGLRSNPPMRHPLLDFISESDGMKVDIDVNKSSFLLLVVSACAEAFPSGRCWASTSHKQWFTLRPDDKEAGDLVYVKGCSVGDLSLLVHVAASVLEASGSSSGDPELQMLSLVCLIRLSEAQRVLVSFVEGADMLDLATSWRKVWALLFRSDLRYAASTAHASEGSCGELVLILLTEIVQGWCTDPEMTFERSVSLKQSTFLYRKQCQIWALPAFGKGTSLRTKQAFELACAFLHRTCLSDEGRDSIQDEALATEENAPEEESQRAVGRRRRLVCLCLHVLDSLKPAKVGPHERQMATVVTACLSALVNGKISLLSRTFLDESQDLTWTRSSRIDDLKNRFCFTEMSGAAVSMFKVATHDARNVLFHTLWTSPILDPGASSLQHLRWDAAKRSDCALAEKLKLCARIQSLDASSVHADYVPTSMSTSLHDLLQSQMKVLLARWTSGEGEDTAAATDGNESVLNENPREVALSVSFLWLKVSFATCALVVDEKVFSGLEQMQVEVLSTFERVSSDLPTLCEDRDEFHSVFLDLLEITRFLTEVSSILSVEIPASLRGGLSTLAGICDSLLLSFAGELQSDQAWGDDAGGGTQSASSSDESVEVQVKTNITDLLDDSDDDDVVNKKKKEVVAKKKTKRKHKKRKRKSPRNDDGSPSRKKKKRHPSPPDSFGACIVGSVLVTLEPSVARCESVVDCLLKKGDRDSEVDIADAYHCLILLDDASVVFHENAVSELGESTTTNAMDESFRQQSPISLMCQVIQKLRFSAGVASSMHMFGFQVYADCVRLGESELRGLKLTMDESKQIAEPLLEAHPSLHLRPYLRSARLQAATDAYLQAGDNLTSAMEKFRNLVVISLKDLCPLVRFYSCQAAGAALHILSNKEAIVKNVSNRLPPVVLPEESSGKGKQKTYQEWYQNFDLGTGDVDAENHVWEDALISMERSAIECHSVFAGMEAEFTRNIVYNFIKIASSRPELEATCFHACENIALVLGYNSAEDYLSDMSDSLFGKWLESGETLGGTPLLLSSPRLIRLLLKTGQQPYLHVERPAVSGKEETKSLNGTNLEDVATDEFVARKRAFILPQMLLRICSSKQSEELDSMAKVARDKNFEEFCVSFKGVQDEETIKAVVQSGLHDIEALCAPMNHSELATLAGGLMKVVRDLLFKKSEEEAEQKKRGKPHLIVRRILELSGKEPREIFPAHIVQEAFSEAISGFVDKLKPTKNGDILSAAGTSLTECFLYSRMWLESATLRLQIEMRFKTMSLLFDLIIKQIHRKEFKQTQLLFGVNVLVDVLLNRSLACIHTKTLAVLNQILEEVVASVEMTDVLKEQFSLASKRLVGALMKIHQESQQELVTLCSAKGKEKQEILQRSVGLLGKQAGSDTWGWDDSTSVALTRRPLSLAAMLREFQSNINKFLIEAITGTFDLLQKIFDNASVLGLKQECFVGCMPPYTVSVADQEALAVTNPRYCAQKVAKDFVQRSLGNETEGLSQSIASLLTELKNRASWMDSLSGAPQTSKLLDRATNGDEIATTLSMSQWMLRAELVQLEHKLRDTRMSNELCLRDGDSLRLVQELSFVCGASCPEQLRSAASRCLGELDPKRIEKGPAVQTDHEQDRIQKALEKNDLLRGIQADAIEVLGEYLYSIHSGVAIAAVDTLIAVLATHDGSKCWDLLDAKVQERLLPVLSGKRRPLNANKLALSKPRVASLRSKAGVAVDEETEKPGWCWEKSLWLCPSDMKASYECWICDLVPALIVCCYRDATNLKSSSAFFGVCQTMASIAPRFATAIFPAIVLDLLERSADDVAGSPQSVSSVKLVAHDTWIGPSDSGINKQLSSNFEILLGQSNDPVSTQGSQDARAIVLALNTLDLLRRATQIRFQKSESHKRNSNAMPTTPRSSKKSSKSSRNSKSANDSVDMTEASDYNVGLREVVPWRGVPFGTVLKLNGEQIVQACIRVQRYASALFYAGLYFESCFAGSGAVMEKLAHDFAGASAGAVTFSKTDVSGYYVDAKACEPSVLRERAVSSLKLLEECYMRLNEVDAYQAAEKQSSDLRYSDCNSLAIDNGEEGNMLVPSLGELQRLDSISNTTRYPVTTSLQTADAIESLGLRNLLQSYIGSMELSKVSTMPDKDRRKLREKWFESRLYGMDWDSALSDVPGTDSISPGRRGFNASSKQVVLGESEVSREEMGFHEAITDALSSFARDDLQSCQGFLSFARGSLLEPISALANVESSGQGVCPIVERLQFLNDVENMVTESESVDTLLQRWGFSGKQDGVQAQAKPHLVTSFASAEFSPHAQEVVLRFLRFKSSQQQQPATEAFDPQQCLVEHLWGFGRWCRQMKFLPTAESSLQRLRSVLQARSTSGGVNSASLELILGQRLEEAHLRESKGDFATAIRVTKQTIGLLTEEKKRRNGSDPGIDCILVDSLISCGDWLSKNKIEPARIILDTYHQPGALLAKDLFRQSERPEYRQRYLKAQLALARLASSLYDSTLSRIKSPEWRKAGRSLADREEEMKQLQKMIIEIQERLREMQKKSKKTIDTKNALFNEQTDLVHYGRTVKSEVRLAKDERSNTLKASKSHLILAVKSFASALSIAKAGEAMDMSRHVFRMVFLWLSTCSEGKENPSVNAIIDEYIDRIPSFRFVPLTSQLFAQIDNPDNSEFQSTLHKLVTKLCRDHPYHCLVQLVSMCNGRQVGDGVSGRNKEHFLENVSSSKVHAAVEIADDLKRKEPAFVGELLDNYTILMDAYIKLANAPTQTYVDSGQTKRILLNRVDKKSSLDRCLARQQECIPCVLTSPPPLRSGCDYGGGTQDPIGGERIKGFESTFAITDSGLHRPKIVMCEGSKGGRFRQLVKGEDEIRQDAVMEQVFGYLNDLMRRKGADAHGRSSGNDLHMATYNIIPLSPASGVLEWVENSMTFGDYVLDSKSSNGHKLGAHSRYYPGEWGQSRCRMHYAKGPKELKRETFETVCRAFSPSFRFFFVERFGHSLMEWYQKKMKYTRSVAVSSIVGHILGIGDRHTNNILVSQITGEVVHIDFGIVFEQGKLLAVPELVPFRLTRNIIDGMGPTGTEGTFAKSAEATAVVLRENANSLLTILSAIASDPLYRWTVSPVEARCRQRLDENQPTNGKEKKIKDRASMTESKSERNEAAELVLGKIQEKLQGYEDGTSGEQQGIEGQVQLLINSARDPANLSVMFAGWAPWV